MSRVLITGASKGIGRATVAELVSRGHEVVATARDPGTLSDLPATLRIALDVTDQASVDAAVGLAGHIDAVVNNAGVTVRAPVETVPLAEVDRLFQLNTLGALRVTQAIVPAMRIRGSGRLLFVSSILGRLTIPLVGSYAASKWALEALAETLAVEVGHFGIRVSILEPAAVSSQATTTAATYIASDDPYRPLADALASARSGAIAVEDVATAIADSLEDGDPPLRVPVGPAAASVLAARATHDASGEQTPFRVIPFDW